MSSPRSISEHFALTWLFLFPQRRLEKVEEILEEILKKNGMPKEDLRKNWNAKKTESEKLMKQ